MCIRCVWWPCRLTSSISPLTSKLLRKTPFLYQCHRTHTVTILTTLALQFLGFLSALMKEQWLLSAVCPPLSVQLSLSLSFFPSSSSASLHPRNADFRPQGLKSGWRGANYYGKENKTQREGGKKR